MFDSILSYGRYRYLKLASMLVLVALLVYVSGSPDEPSDGGTWQGYTLGVMGAALILLLIWFGIRKRQYHRTETSLAGWASAHVYLGISLPIVVSLHCGFQFGWNIHTLAYALMVLVVLSGFYGLYAYLVFPLKVTKNRNGISRKELIAAIAQLDETGLTLAEELGGEAHHRVLQAVVETRLGGTLWQQLTQFMVLPLLPFLQWKLAGSSPEPQRPVLGETALGPEDYLQKYLQKSQSTVKLKQVVELLKVLNERQFMVNRVQRDIRYHTLMKCWLLLHIPLACALLAAVIIHVIAVFFYW